MINLLFAGLQFSHLGIGGLIDNCVLDPWTITLLSTRSGVLNWGVSGETLKFIEISLNFQGLTRDTPDCEDPESGG